MNRDEASRNVFLRMLLHQSGDTIITSGLWNVDIAPTNSCACSLIPHPDSEPQDLNPPNSMLGFLKQNEFLMRQPKSRFKQSIGCTQRFPLHSSSEFLLGL
mmetsp:Transcript_25004/g.61607  ORF Transcript_25004/g.61607 Transcript_25004/m.61607 type:complete len:101 (-) Transcript_25004:430-732(-)